jgi:hypothetical protein
VGHSLGASAMVAGRSGPGTKKDGPRLDAHLVNAAIGAKSDWDTTARVDDAVYIYHSTNEQRPEVPVRPRPSRQTPASLKGFAPSPPKLKNIDVSAQVKRHSDYHTKVTLL